MSSYFSHQTQPPISQAHQNFRSPVVINIRNDRHADTGGKFCPPDLARLRTVIRQRVKLAMTGTEDKLGLSIAVDVAAGDGTGGAVQWIFPAHLSGRDLEARKSPVLPAKSHQPLSVRALQKTLGSGVSFAHDRAAVPLRDRVRGHRGQEKGAVHKTHRRFAFSLG